MRLRLVGADGSQFFQTCRRLRIVRIGLVSDAHGNAQGLERCLHALEKEGIDRLYFLGDAVGYLPGETMVLDILCNWNVVPLLGNHEAMMLGRLPLSADGEEVYRLRPAAERLGSERLRWIRSWRELVDTEIDGRHVIMVHGSPEQPLTGRIYPDSQYVPKSNFADAIFVGHTHYPSIRHINGTHVVNVGSCGLPRDVGHIASACIYDTRSNSAQLLRVTLDPVSILESCESSKPHESVTALMFRDLQRGASDGELT